MLSSNISKRILVNKSLFEISFWDSGTMFHRPRPRDCDSFLPFDILSISVQSDLLDHFDA